jgi:uncharacterized membrane protein YcjF (UPF0283 family)
MANAADQLPTLLDQVRGLWKAVRLGLVAVAVFVLAGLALECRQLYLAAHDLHPWAGYAALVGFTVALLPVLIPAWRFLRTPVAVKPPNLPPVESWQARHARWELRFLDAYLANLGRNPHGTVDHAAVAAARAELVKLRDEADTVRDADVPALVRKIRGFRDGALAKSLNSLDARADRLIYQEALTVGLATAASPNGTLDAFVMLWRSTRLVSQLAALYYGRPGVLGTLAVCKDVMMATAFAGFLQNVTDSLGGLLAKTVGGVGGVVAGPAVDGVTNALVLIRIGYLARERCRSMSSWDQETRQSAILAALASTQRVAVGLTMEILRQTGSVVGAVAGAAASAAKQAAGTVAGTVMHAAGSAAAGFAHFAETVAESVQTAATSAAQSFSERSGPQAGTEAGKPGGTGEPKAASWFKGGWGDSPGPSGSGPAGAAGPSFGNGAGAATATPDVSARVGAAVGEFAARAGGVAQEVARQAGPAVQQAAAKAAGTIQEVAATSAQTAQELGGRAGTVARDLAGRAGSVLHQAAEATRTVGGPLVEGAGKAATSLRERLGGWFRPKA